MRSLKSIFSKASVRADSPRPSSDAASLASALSEFNEGAFAVTSAAPAIGLWMNSAGGSAYEIAREVGSPSSWTGIPPDFSGAPPARLFSLAFAYLLSRFKHDTANSEFLEVATSQLRQLDDTFAPPELFRLTALYGVDPTYLAMVKEYGDFSFSKELLNELQRRVEFGILLWDMQGVQPTLLPEHESDDTIAHFEDLLDRQYAAFLAQWLQLPAVQHLELFRIGDRKRSR
jgi:hypothetical protein